MAGGTGGGARPWLVENITAGEARNGHADLSLEATDDLADVALTGATGTLDGNNLTVHWLRPVPPAEGASAQLRIVDPDTVEITVSSGRQRSGKAGLTLRNGRMRITGLSKHDQFAAIQADISGSVPDAIALLKEPRLQLLDKHPIDLRDPAGEAAVTLAVTLPLDNKVQMEDITIHAVSHLTGVHLGAFVAGRDLDQGNFDLDATADGLTVKGQGQLAGIAAQVDAAMDFRSGPPNQVVQKAVVTGHPGAGQLAAAGLDPSGALFGEVPMKATYTQHRAGDAEIALTGDLTGAVLAVPPIGWRKPVGAVAKASATVLLDKDKLRSIDRITVDGDGLMVRGSARAAGGQIVAVQLDRAVFGRNDVHGSVQWPDGSGPITASLSRREPGSGRPVHREISEEGQEQGGAAGRSVLGARRPIRSRPAGRGSDRVGRGRAGGERWPGDARPACHWPDRREGTASTPISRPIEALGRFP